MNHITAALDLIAQNQIAAWLCVAVVVFIASIALMIGHENAENKAALNGARADGRLRCTNRPASIPAQLARAAHSNTLTKEARNGRN
jgi:hypothetical protein